MLISEIPKYSQRVLQEELTVTAQKIGENMKRNDQVVSGRTMRSLRVEATSNEGVLYGAEHFDTLEKGISPERSRLGSLPVLYRKIDTWQQARGLGWRKSESFMAARKQQIDGSVLHRLGGRDDVYSSEVDLTLKRISDKIGKGFVTAKYLE